MSPVGRIASLLPSATEIVCALGLEDRLVGVSHSCDHPSPIRGKPRLTRPRFPLDGLSSGEIDAAVRQALRQFGSVYEVDTERLAALGPDLLLTQGVCEVCAVPTRDAAAAAAGLASCPSVLALDAHDVAGVLETIRLVGRAGGVPERAKQCVRNIDRRIASWHSSGSIRRSCRATGCRRWSRWRAGACSVEPRAGPRSPYGGRNWPVWIPTCC